MGILGENNEHYFEQLARELSHYISSFDKEDSQFQGNIVYKTKFFKSLKSSSILSQSVSII